MQGTTEDSSKVRSTPAPIEEIETVVIRFCGDSGDGMQLTGGEFTKAAAVAGNDISTLPDFPAEIRAPAGSLAGVSGFQLHFSSLDVQTPGDQPHVLVAMNPAALKTNLPDLVEGGILVINTGAFTKGNLAKANIEVNPLEDGSLDGYRTHLIDISKLTANALADTGMSTKDIARCKNFYALGLMYWMYNRKTERQIESINKKFAKRPEIADANVKAFKAGYHFGETAEIFNASYVVKPAKIEPGEYKNVTGNSATAMGLVAAAHLADVDLFFGGYPITPASDILHELSAYRQYGVTTFQAEDEIAGITSAIGAAFGGALAITASSGPGIALKAEAMGLAVITELPLVIINVQRGGPSTGLPTKTEQSDLFQALYGRNGECPMPVLAARTPADCFDTAIEACRIAIKYMTPVMLLSDGYLANGAEPWKLPKLADLKPFKAKFRTDPNDYNVYARDSKTMARAWVKPGTPGLEHRIGGIEKDSLTGDVSYDPENHHAMCVTRADKVQLVQQDIGELLLTGDDSGDVLLVGWGSTYGAIYKATTNMQKKGHKVSSVHLRFLCPLNPNLGDLLKKFKRILVPELNLGQLLPLLRSTYLVDAKGINKVQGKPFKVSELENAIEEALR